MEGVVFEERLLRLVQMVVFRVRDEIVGGEKNAAGTAGRIGDSLARFRPHALHHGADQGARGEILARAGLGVLGVLFQQTFIDVALHIRAHHHPLGAVHHVDQAIKLGRVLNLVLRLGEDLSQHPLWVPSSRNSSV